MPTYQYACTQCGHDFEAVQSFSDASLTECPRCDGRLRKVFAAVGIVFKGSGFYRNDSRDGKKPAADAAASTDTQKTETKTETKKVDATGNGSAATTSSSSGSSTTSARSSATSSSTAGSAA